MLYSIILVLAWVGLATYADTCFKKAPKVDSLKFFTGMACYAATSFFAIATFKRQQWGWILITWNCTSLLVSMILSVVLFDEPFTKRRMIATILTLIAILMSE
jgi:multidrug transporter EmrE-like cation transporter